MLENYLNDPRLKFEQNFDSLSWWRLNQQKFPTLVKMTRDYLSIQATTVPSEKNQQ